MIGKKEISSAERGFWLSTATCLGMVAGVVLGDALSNLVTVPTLVISFGESGSGLYVLRKLERNIIYGGVVGLSIGVPLALSTR